MAHTPCEKKIGFADSDQYARARDILADANYTSLGLQNLIGASDITVTRPYDLAPVLNRLRGDSKLETLTRLFFLNLPVPREAAARALQPMPLEDWSAAQMLSVEGDRVEPAVRLRPYHHLYFAADKPIDILNGTRADFVMGVAKSSMLVERTAIRPNLGRTLDLGTGSGVLGLLARPFSSEVYATDKNPRAIAFTEFNAKLNRLDRVTALSGDLFEPLADQRFDTILCNPPYVISPSTQYMFCHSGQSGDEFCRSIIRAIPAYLNEGGFCHLVCNWPHAEGHDWKDSAREWFQGLGCDVLVFGGGTQSATEYAMTWIRETEPEDDATVAERFAGWMDYLNERDIAAVSYGVVSIRRASGQPNWIHLEESPEGFQGPCGLEIQARFQAWDHGYRRTEADDLLNDRFRMSDNLRIRQVFRPASDGMTAEGTILELKSALSVTAEADSTITQLILLMDGKRTLRQVLEEMSRVVDVSLEQLIPEGLNVVRELVGRGFLLPHSFSPPEDGSG